MTDLTLVILIGLGVTGSTAMLVLGVKNGRLWATGSPTCRDKEPVAFWTICALHAIVTASFAAAAVMIWTTL